MLLITCTALLRGAMPRDRFILVYTCLTLLGCGGSSTPTAQPTPHVSSGLKIFLTSRKHVADFKNDPYLNGDSAIHKADDFCNTDPNRPDAHAYKALLVDGVNRDAKALTDWVLKPSTTYYRPYDVLPAVRRHRSRHDDRSGHLRRSLRTAYERHRRHRLAGRDRNRGMDRHRQLGRLHGGRLLQRLVGRDELVERALGHSHRQGRERVWHQRVGRLRGLPVLDLLRRAALTAAVAGQRVPRATGGGRKRSLPATYGKAGADKNILRRCTDQPYRDVMEAYSTFGWHRSARRSSRSSQADQARGEGRLVV